MKRKKYKILDIQSSSRHYSDRIKAKERKEKVIKKETSREKFFLKLKLSSSKKMDIVKTSSKKNNSKKTLEKYSKEKQKKIISHKTKKNFQKKFLNSEKLKQTHSYQKNILALKFLKQLVNRLKIFMKLRKKMVFFLIFLVILSGSFFYYKKMKKIQGRVLGISDHAYQETKIALEDIKRKNFISSSEKLEESAKEFELASQELEKLGKPILAISAYLPYFSRLFSGYNLLQAGKELATAGKEISSYLQELNQLNENNDFKNFSWLSFFQKTEKQIKNANQHLEKANQRLKKVEISDLPNEKQVTLIKIKRQIKIAQKTTDFFVNNSYILEDLLGKNGPRKYLFLFQNNQEIRATGGFIGSYGLLNVKNGKIEKFFIEGIFNPDGQLKDNIIPPRPIQKISKAWSLHDSNWWPDFPKSAEKAMVFYEKTGGPTVDGVIAITPDVLKKLLKITGPIYLSQYDIYISNDNFLKMLQTEVEIGYDKNENRPKKILGTLSQIILKKIFQAENMKETIKIIPVLLESLKEKDILIYSKNNDLEKIIISQGWGGKIKETQKDYLNVINSNINGYKTDGVIKQKIKQMVSVRSDGSIINDLFIIREHQGKNSFYEWWNKVNADYLRVYIPLGSKLILAEGQTKEKLPSLKYDSRKFKIDKDVLNEEKNIKRDKKSGTYVYEDSGKTVLANWVYVSPGEKVTVHYKYQLPFYVNLTDKNNYYSLLVQKQAGIQSDFSFQLKYPLEWKLKWKSMQLKSSQNKLDWRTVLNQDNFISCLWEEN